MTDEEDNVFAEDFCNECGSSVINGRCEHCQSTKRELGQRASEPISDYSTWIQGQRLLSKQLGLKTLKDYFSKHCDVCGALVPSYFHLTLCEIHRVEYQKWKNRERQRKFRQKQKTQIGES